MRGPSRRLAIVSLVLAMLVVGSRVVQSGAFIFAGHSNGLDVITHPQGYVGTGTTLNISIGIDPTSANAASMATPVQNLVNTINSLSPTTGNLVFGGSNNIPTGFVDFESVALHEVLHSLGLAHPNLATESGLVGDDQDYTKATDGVDDNPDVNTPGDYNLGIGADGIRGSSDDVRGNDVNLHWFRTSDNNPFTIGATVDSTAYSRDIASLPGGHTFVANADRSVGGLLGVLNTEAVMQQGTFADEAQRTLGHDDVATFRLAMAGVDELQGTPDDYTVVLSYAGLTLSADIVLDFDNAQTGFAVSISGGAFIGTDHVRITTTAVYFNDGFNWFFNDVPNGCNYSLAPTSGPAVSAGGASAVAVTAGSGCAWTAVSNSAFVTVTGGSSGSGNGTVNYTVATNSATSPRSGSMTIAGQTFTVSQNAGFTTPTITVGATTVQAVHVTQLRTRIDALRSSLMLSAFPWTGTLTPGSTAVLAVHVTEPRTALAAAYTAAMETPPTYTDPGLAAGTTVRAVHINELRSAVENLELVVP
jgi:hypothetical protein